MIRLYYLGPASLLALGLDMALWHPYDIAIEVLAAVLFLWALRAIYVLR